jgi:hypothetical protein
VNVVAPASIDSQGNLWTASGDAQLTKTSSAGGSTPITTLAGGVEESSVVLSDGSVVVGDSTAKLSRVSSAGAAVWSPVKTVSGNPLTPLVLSGSFARLLVGTRGGTVYALADDGSTVWSTTLSGSPALKGTNISFPSTETPVTSTAYFSASNGKVYAVIVDGTLDTTAPWPKAFRDRRNRSNAGATP